MTDDARERAVARDTLMLASLPHVVFDGWSPAAMAAGAADAGMDPVAVRRYFPGGAAEMVGLFSAWADGRMIAALDAADLDSMKVRERVTLAVRARLEALTPHREAARRTVSFLALPTNAPLGVKCLYRTVDDIWYAIGDRSADFSFYTKRGLLAGVYGAVSLYWLEDRSEDFADSWAFLDRRIADVMRIQKATGRFEGLRSRLPDPFRLARQFAMPRR